MKLSRLLGFSLLVLTVAACTSSDQPLKFRDGTFGYHVYCGGQIYASKDDCLSRADQMCGAGGYTVVAEGDPPYAHNESMWSLTTHDIIVRCNKQP